MTFEPPSQGIPPENVPPPGYTPPTPSYPSAPEGFSTPPPAYAPPPPAYTPPAQGYGAPPQGYVPPNASPNPAGRVGAGFNPAAVNPLDWGILAAGFLTFVFSFFSYYTVSVRGFGGGHENAWHGFFGWFAAFVALLSAGLVAVEYFAPQIKLPVPVRLASLGGFVLALICVLLALVVFPQSVPSGFGISKGRGFGYWIDLILIIAGVALSVLRLKATGGSLPWEKSGGSGSAPAGYVPPAQPGQYQPGHYQPPTQPGQYQPPTQPGGYQPDQYQPPTQPGAYPPPEQPGQYPPPGQQYPPQ
jgi:hypothetical protein